MFVGFTGNDRERASEIFEEVVSKLNPALKGPVLLVAAASGMKRNDRSCQSGEKFQSTMSIFAGRIKSRCKVGNWQTEFFDWLRQLESGMGAIRDLGWSPHNFSGAAASQIVFEN